MRPNLRWIMPASTRWASSAGAVTITWITARWSSQRVVGVKVTGERLRRELRLRDVRVERLGVQENRMAPDRLDDGDAPVEQVIAEIFHLTDARADVVVVDAFHDAARHRFHVAAGQAAVSVQAFVNDHQVASFLV